MERHPERGLTIALAIAILLNSLGSSVVALDRLFDTRIDYSLGIEPSSVSAADLDGDGDNDLAVSYLGPDPDNSDGWFSIMLNNGNGTYAESAKYTVGRWPKSALLADFDGDGDSDLAVTTHEWGMIYDYGLVKVFRNTGNGAFEEPESYRTFPYPFQLHAVDLNGDSAIDLTVLGGQSSRHASVLMNNGDGSYTELTGLFAGGRWTGPTSVSSADFDRDGDNDLAITFDNDGDTSDVLVILRNSGNGSFEEPISYPTGALPGSVCSADLDRDGDSDLVVVNCGSDPYYGGDEYGSVTVFFNEGNGTLADATNYSLGDYNRAWLLAVVDLDGDNDLDLVLTNQSIGAVLTMFNNGDGTFAEPERYMVGETPTALCTADLDGDSHPDLAVTYEGTDNVSTLFNDGCGNLMVPVPYGAGSLPYGTVSADFDGDGDHDLAVANTNSDDISVLENDGKGVFAAPSHYAGGNYPNYLCAADFDGDNAPDLVVANHLSDTISVLLNLGDGTFSPPVGYAVGDQPYAMISRDLNGDGDQDLAIINTGADNVSILLNEGSGVFGVAADYPTGDHPHGITSADFDEDGDCDLAVVHKHSDRIAILRNDGSGAFWSILDFAAGASPSAITTQDFDGDSDFDLAVANLESDDVSILINDGFGSFSRHKHFAAGDGPWGIATGDYDGDGDHDLAVENRITKNVTILLNAGDAVFKAAGHYGIAAGLKTDCFEPSLFASADFNSDGCFDLATTNRWGLSVLINTSDGDRCCGRYTAGYTGNCNCGVDGKLSVEDITTLVDHLYISRAPLCCRANGNVNGSADGSITLSDILRLVDAIYISKNPTEPCPD